MKNKILAALLCILLTISTGVIANADTTDADNNNTAIPARRIEVPVWEKSTLTLDEAAAYSGIFIYSDVEADVSVIRAKYNEWRKRL